MFHWATCFHKLAAAFVAFVVASVLTGHHRLAADDADAEATPLKKRVLLVTGEDYKGHKWQLTSPVLEQLLEQDKRLSVDVLDDLTQLGEVNLADYDAVVMHFKNYDPKVPGREGYDALAEFVEAGGGLVLVHFACGAFQEFKNDFTRLAGRVWNPKLRGHDPRGTFRVEITKTNHPVTDGLQSFETTDELYTCLDGETPITVLAESTSKVNGKVYPMAFVLTYGQGRVFHNVLGHDVKAFAAPSVRELFRRGTAWVSGLVP